MWDSPLPVFPSPSSTVDPYPEEWGHFSPPKHHYAAPPFHHDTRLHANIRKVGYYGSSSSLTMIDESLNDSSPYWSEAFPTDGVLFEDETLNQKNNPDQKISNLSLQMKKYLSTNCFNTSAVPPEWSCCYCWHRYGFIPPFWIFTWVRCHQPCRFSPLPSNQPIND